MERNPASKVSWLCCSALTTSAMFEPSDWRVEEGVDGVDAAGVVDGVDGMDGEDSVFTWGLGKAGGRA